MSRFQTDAKFRAFIINLLRKGTFRWKPRSEAQREARVAPATSKCANCGDWIYHGASKEIPEDIVPPVGTKIRKDKMIIEHVIPIVNPEVGFESLDIFVEKLFCDKTNLACYCKTCSSIKTKAENQRRTEARRKKKLAK